MRNDTYKQLCEAKNIIDRLLFREAFTRLKAEKKREEAKLVKKLQTKKDKS